MRDLPASLTSLLDAALGGDDPEDLLELAHRELGGPVGLVGRAGQPLAHAPHGDGGDRALAVAAAGARSRLVAPPGWTIVPIEHAAVDLGVLAYGGSREPLLDLVVTLLGDQLQRRELLRGRNEELLRRLVSEKGADVAELRRDAAELGFELASAYWLAVLSWHHALPRPAVIDTIEREAGLDGLIVRRARRLVLMQPASGGPRPDWFERVVGRARALARSAGAQAVAADTPVELGAVGARAAELEALSQLAPRTEGEAPVISARRYALDRLLVHAVGRPEAQAFVTEQLGPLIAWDREHNGTLLTVLEAALDFPRHEQAAARCYMHRNTFRHRLRQATEILHEDLGDADRRLALHVALKLQKALVERSRRPVPAHR
jgi:hypothetical protein